MKNQNSIIVVFTLILAACTGELSSEEVRDKVCKAGDASYCDGSTSDGGEVAGSDIASADADTGQDADTQEQDAQGTDILNPDASDASELPEPDTEGELPEPDVPDVQIAETDAGEEIDVADTDEVEGDADISEDSDTNELPDTATQEDADTGEDDGSDADAEGVPDSDGGDADAEPETSEPDIAPDVESDTEPDTAVPPKCVSNEACDDGNPCTDNLCDPAVGCASVNNSASCTDNSACTEDICSGGSCLTKAIVCDDSNLCTTDSCDAVKGCIFTPNTASCNDGNACTDSDTCVAGACKGTPKNCDDGNTCTEDICLGGSCLTKVVPKGYGCGQNALCKESVCTTVSVPDDRALVPAGEYWMGCNAAVDSACKEDENPARKVFVSAFFIHKLEVRNEDYVSCYIKKGAGCEQQLPQKPGCSWFAPDNKELPVNCLTWSQADALCKWKGMRLPTEAEWQKAARGGCEKYQGDCQASMPVYPWGNTPPTCKNALFGGCSSFPVNNFTPLDGVSPYGAHHMAGNVAEWLADWYGPYPADQTIDPQGPPSGAKKAYAGGYYSSSAAEIRASHRAAGEPGSWSAAIGMRCVNSVTF